MIIKGGKALDQDKSYDLYYDGDKFYQLTTDMFNKVITTVQVVRSRATTAYLANGKSQEKQSSAKAFVASAIKTVGK